MSDKKHTGSLWMEIFRWLTLPVPLVICAVLIWYLTFWLGRHGLPRRWLEPFALFLSALFGTLVSGWWAPRARRLTAVALLITALVLACNGVVGWYDPVTQEPTILPFSAGLTGWMIGAALVFLHAYRRDRRLDQKP